MKETYQDRPVVRVTQIGEYVRHGSCERRFKLDSDERRLTRALPFFYTLSGTMDPVLAEAGKEREREWEGHLQAAGLTDLCRYGERPGDKSTPWEILAGRVEALTSGAEGYGREIDVLGHAGAFLVAGRIDFALVRWDRGRPRLRLVECKASRKDRTYQRVQLVLYRMLVRQLLEEQPLIVAGHRMGDEDVECVVVRLDENSNRPQDILALPPLDLEMEEADVRLLLAPGGTLQNILAKDVGDTAYQLDAKCDDCSLSLYCLPEAARRRQVQLLGVDPSTVRALSAAGVEDLDALATLPLDGPAAAAIRMHPDFNLSLDTLSAKARSRRSTLPARAPSATTGQAEESEAGADPNSGVLEHNDVIPLPHSGSGRLPPHQTGASRLLRIYLSVSYDYVENRVGAVSAHVTRSDRPLSTLFMRQGGNEGEKDRWRPDPIVKEQWATGTDADGRKVFAERALEAAEFVGVIPRPWTGDFEEDTRREADMLSGFFIRLVEAARQLGPEGRAPLHFYVWSRNEITRLVEACARADANLLGSLRELLGCREGLEQLIFSCLADEVDSRYGLGWTSRGLAAATSLRWFGRRFHWTRRVGNEDLALDRIFAEGIFDFKTALRYDDRGAWLPLDADEGSRHAFEIRASFGDALPAPYWRAQWGTLPDPDAPGLTTDKLRRSVRAYGRATQPGRLKAYLRTRVQALRWIEEGVRDKNAEIAKPLVDLTGLPDFTLGVETAAQAALDFLWLEQRVAANDWVGTHLIPPAGRVPLGRTLPVRDVHAVAANRLEATVDLTGYPLEAAALRSRCSLAEGAFVRLSPCDPDPNRGQTIARFLRGGSTCRIESLDWASGRLELSVLPYTARDDRYMLPSLAWPEGRTGYSYATVDEGLSDFVAGKVDDRLRSGLGKCVTDWFDPQTSVIPASSPVPEATLRRYRAFLQDLNLGHGPLARDQAAAAVDGLNARVQLLQGPPGTGKTQTVAAAVLLRILARRQAGDVHRRGDVILVGAGTHMAVDTLLRRVASLLPHFAAGALAAGLEMPAVRLAKAQSSGGEPTGEGIEDFDTYGCGTLLTRWQTDSVLVIGGTPNALLKMARDLNKKAPWSEAAAGFQAEALVVDEASMMVLPPFLALASLVCEDGEILLAGDHRQLAPILHHDWEREDRPPARLFRPHASAYDAVRSLKERRGLADESLLLSALTFTFRLPPPIRSLIARLYRLDGLTLEGYPALHSPPPAHPRPPAAGYSAPLAAGAGDLWHCLWREPTGLFLVTHDEAASKQSNPLEAEIIARLLGAAGPLPSGSVGIVVPHRAQRALLKTLLGSDPAVDVIDTVERFQGGERPTIIVSATASDPAAINARAEFILGLNRANVAFSRAQYRLIVVCSERLIAHLPPSAEHYAEAMLWKSLRAVCSEPMGQAEIGGHTARFWTAPAGG